MLRRLLAGVDQERHDATDRHLRGAKAVIDHRAATRLSAVVGDGEFPEHAVAAEGEMALGNALAAALPARLAPATALAAAALACLWAGSRSNQHFGNQVGHTATAGGFFVAPTAAATPMFGAGRDPGDTGGDPAMNPKNLARMAAAMTAAVTANGALAGDAVQWRVADGGNGHWYEFVSGTNVPGGPNFDAQDNACASRGGYMATIESVQEWDFFRAAAPTSGGYWIGLRSDRCVNWRWSTGGTLGFSEWGSASCGAGPYPNNCSSSNLRAAAGNRFDCGWMWDDYPQGLMNFTAYCIEWSADCNNDGIVDYGQIRDGTFSDTNANGVPDCCESGQTCCIGDIYHDGIINGADLGIVLAEWGPVTPTTHSDLDHNGRVDGADLGLLLSHWGPCGG